MDKDTSITLSARHTRSVVKDTHVRGIDVSAAQGKPRWGEVLEDPAGITFAWIKATDGLKGGDASFAYNARELRAMGGELLWGAYHVAHPRIGEGHTNESDARAEARRLVDMAGDAPLPPWVDFEVNDGTSVAAQAEWLYWHVKEMHALLPHRPILYAGLPVRPTLLGCAAWILEYAIIVPAYWNRLISGGPEVREVYGPPISFESAEATSLKGKAPTVAPWTAPSGWQFSGGLDNRDTYMPGHTIRGITGWVDCDIFTTGAWMDLFR